MVNPNDWPLGDIDVLLNIALYSLIGFQVGKATGVVRDAAEAGVLAGVLVGLIGLGVAYVMPLPEAELDTTNEIIYQIASNVVYGGCLGIMAGWFGSRTNQGGPIGRS
jgi:hypothetical protein